MLLYFYNLTVGLQYTTDFITKLTLLAYANTAIHAYRFVKIHMPSVINLTYTCIALKNNKRAKKVLK